MTKCDHDLCLLEAETDSKYCKNCIQLPTKECNLCTLKEMTENRKLSDAIEQRQESRKQSVVSFVVAAIIFIIIVGGSLMGWF